YAFVVIVLPDPEDVAALMNAENLYERDIVIAAKIMTSSPFPERRMQAVKDIGHWAWSGGPPVAKFASNYLVNLISIANNHSLSVDMVKSAVQAMGNICCSSKEASLRSSAVGLVEVLCKLLEHYKDPEHNELKHNIISTLLIVIIENNDNQKIVVMYPSLKESLRHMIKEDWRSWSTNEAQRLYTFLGYDRQNERKQSLTTA
ncbi:hypothetical protein QZH41_009069, partial [Actinostola sp. cb2023]